MRTRVEAWRSWPTPQKGGDLWEWQDGRCAMCGVMASRIVRDHCHDTGLVRGLLCSGCNTAEGTSNYGGRWDAWRSGDNTAAAIGHYEIYVDQLGTTALSPYSALVYYSRDELHAYWERLLADLEAGEPWPAKAPWTEEATALKTAELADAADKIEAFFAKHGMGGAA